MTDTDQKPTAAVSGRVGVNVQAAGETRTRVYGYGDHPDVPNPGHLLLVAETHGVQVAIMLRGREIAALAAAASAAAALYAANAEWLTAPVSRLVSEDAA